MEIALCFPASMLHVHRVALPEKTCKWLFVELLGLPWGFFFSLLVGEQAVGTASPVLSCG